MSTADRPLVDGNYSSDGVYPPEKTPASSSCCVRFLRNWVLWTLILIALLGILLALYFALQPCKASSTVVTTYEKAAIDLILVVDNSGSINYLEYPLEFLGLHTFVQAMINSYTGKTFRAGLINFATSPKMPYNPANYTATELLPFLKNPHRPTDIGVYTNTDLGMNLARQTFAEISKPDTFKLILLVTDGVPGSPQEPFDASQRALTAAAHNKEQNVTIVGIYVNNGGEDASSNVYSMTSCTPRNNQNLVSVDPSCQFYAGVQNFEALNATARHLANVTGHIPTLASHVSHSVCVKPVFFLYLLLLLPLLLYLFAAPVVFFLKRKCCPPKAAAAPPAPMVPVEPTAPPAVAPKGPDGKWAPVNAGGYLWAMGGRAAAVVPVNFGDRAPPSAPGAQLTPAQMAASYTITEAVDEIYGGGEDTVEASKYVCCCFWLCLSDAERAELNGKKAEPSGGDNYVALG